MREEIVGIDTPTHTLATAIVHADTDKPKAVIVMFAGSGPIDRNENLPNFSLNIFNTLAETFARAGVSSVRYDKRGCGASGGDYITAGHSDMVADAIHVTRHVMAHAELKHLPLILLGHSEGAVIAPQVARKLAQMNEAQFAVKNPPIQGLILLCPFARPMRNVLQQQASNRADELRAMSGFSGKVARTFVWLRGGFTGIQTKFLTRLEGSTADTVTIGKATLNAKWYREMLALDIKSILARIDTPTYALGGGKDAQCNPQDTSALNQIVTRAPITTHIEENLTHILRCDDQPAAMGRYPALIKKPIEALVAARCLAWLDALITQKPLA